MNFKCLFGGHNWDGCKCTACGKTRDKGHQWDGCSCSICGKIKDHTWQGCKCSACGETRDQDHTWDGRKCSACGKSRDEKNQREDSKCNVGGTKEIEELIPKVFAKAYNHYQIVMAAASTGNITASVERDLNEALKWLNQLCDIDSSRGEPLGLRGAMYMILAQIERQSKYLDQAENDFAKAIEIGSTKSGNISNWKSNLSDARKLRGLI